MADVSLREVISPAFYKVHRAVREGLASEIVLHGGRGSAKSSYASIEIILQMIAHPTVHAVALRQIGNTLRTSVYAQLCWAIDALGIADRFKRSVSPMQITYRQTGQTIYFFGMDDPGKLKSFKVPFGYVGILWFEELDQFAGEKEVRNVEQSMLRGGDFALRIKTFNPPTTPRNFANQYVLRPHARQIIHHSDYRMTPRAWLGESFIQGAEQLMHDDETAYRHEYLGEVIGSGTAVFDNIRPEPISDEQIRTFDRVYRGVDWGYYPDPFAYNECHYDAARRTLYIFGELTCRRMGNTQTAELIKKRDRHELITADSAEPKSIGDYKSLGMPCVGAKKGPGSVEHGMKWLASLRAIVIDPRRCPDTIKEFSDYELDRDKDGNIIDGYPDRYNHHIDAVRYAMESVATQRVARVERR